MPNWATGRSLEACTVRLLRGGNKVRSGLAKRLQILDSPVALVGISGVNLTSHMGSPEIEVVRWENIESLELRNIRPHHRKFKQVDPHSIIPQSLKKLVVEPG